ncbi:hypothetical protein B0H16DRAFT_637216 [Mycena metata]|uniref:Uncharacterized protein n=1 Tax=Mycena metata TaxID=1033252 RepID=A0AAD7MCT4_9AGAR|nr:hypothetical protein B0H16DRAFT_637216 [Mycena metata]
MRAAQLNAGKAPSPRRPPHRTSSRPSQGSTQPARPVASEDTSFSRRRSRSRAASAPPEHPQNEIDAGTPSPTSRLRVCVCTPPHPIHIHIQGFAGAEGSDLGVHTHSRPARTIVSAQAGLVHPPSSSRPRPRRSSPSAGCPRAAGSKEDGWRGGGKASKVEAALREPHDGLRDGGVDLAHAYHYARRARRREIEVAFGAWIRGMTSYVPSLSSSFGCIAYWRARRSCPGRDGVPARARGSPHNSAALRHPQVHFFLFLPRARPVGHRPTSHVGREPRMGMGTATATGEGCRGEYGDGSR